jgi:hypothetical protein
MADITGNVSGDYSTRRGQGASRIPGKQEEQKGIGALTRDLLVRVGLLNWLTGAEDKAAVVAPTNPNQPVSRVTGTTADNPRVTGGVSGNPLVTTSGSGVEQASIPITGTQAGTLEQVIQNGDPRLMGAAGGRSAANVGAGGGNTGGGGTPPPTTGGGTPPADDTPNPNQRGGLLASTSDLLGGALKEGNPATRNLGRLGYLAPAVAAFQDYTEGGNPYAVGGGAAAGLGVTALTRSAGRSVGGGKGAVLQMLAPLLGLGTQQLTTAAIQKDRQRKTGEGDPNAFSTQLGRLEQLRKIGNEGQIQMMNAERAGVKDLYGYAVDKNREDIQALAPLIEQQRNNDVVRNQQIMNSMGQNFAMLGSMATTGKLALGAQREAAANLRTFMTAAPYANSVLQAPNITF